MKLALLVSAALATVTAGAAANNHVQISDGHAVRVSGSNFKRWMAFPEQQSLHHSKREGVRVSGAKVVEHDATFFEAHREALGLAHEATFEKFDEVLSNGAAGISIARYSQMIKGVKVFGGEFNVAIGSHGGVVHAHGRPFDLARAGNHDHLEKAKNNIDQKKVFQSVQMHLATLKGVSGKVELATEKHPIELVWYVDGTGVDEQGPSVLAYHLNGKTADGSMTFDAFVDAKTNAVVQFWDKSRRANTYTNPFSSPLSNDITVYNNALKDYNDDKDDYYYSQDPDRYSNATKIFDSSSTYPTGSATTDLLIANTLYTANLMKSISGGVYKTWARDDITLYIETELVLENAFFDGEWGIHFGASFAVDDVIAHEWAHGYTDTANSLIYWQESGAMNEAFSDIIGESIDILNADTKDSRPKRSASGDVCLKSDVGSGDRGHRWSMGEDISSIGAIRDMYSPECFSDPSDTNSWAWYCGYSDNGGVHWNSGVGNKLYALLVDGGSLNGVNVKGIGMGKALNLIWAAFQDLTPTAEYNDLAEALTEHCNLMVGSSYYLPDVNSGASVLSSDMIEVKDCKQVQKAIRATKITRTNNCPSLSMGHDTDAVCDAFSADGKTQDFSHEEFESSLTKNSLVYGYCSYSGQSNDVFQRVFTQEMLGGDKVDLACIEHAFVVYSAEALLIEVWVDHDGGYPDIADTTYMELVGSKLDTYVNSPTGGYPSTTHTVSFDSPLNITLPPGATLVVSATPQGAAYYSYTYGYGSWNPDVYNTLGDTFMSGDCLGNLAYSVQNFWDAVGLPDDPRSKFQWYVNVPAVVYSSGSRSSSSTTRALPARAFPGQKIDGDLRSVEIPEEDIEAAKAAGQRGPNPASLTLFDKIKNALFDVKKVVQR